MQCPVPLSSINQLPVARTHTHSFTHTLKRRFLFQVCVFVALCLCITLNISLCSSNPSPPASSSSSSPAASSVGVSASSSSSSSASLDSSLDEVKYVVGILKSATLAEANDESGDERKVVMTGKSGKRFLCTIPAGRRKEHKTEEIPNANTQNLALNTEPLAPPPSSSASASAGGKSDSPPSASAPPSTAGGPASAVGSVGGAVGSSSSVSGTSSSATQSADQQLLNGFKNHLSRGCFTKTVDFWSYDVCPFSHVSQYHKDAKDATRKEPFFELGKYQPNLDMFHTAAAPYIQIYKFGTDQRESRVRFICNHEAAQTDKTSQHLLVTVSEPKPFKYEFDIKTPLACVKNKPKPTTSKVASAFPSASSATPTRSASATSSSSEPASASASASASSSTISSVASSGSSPASSFSSSSSSPLASVFDVLRPLGDDCQHLNHGWWTYKFCHLRSVSQFHKENKQSTAAAPVEPTAVITQEYALGYFDKDRRLEDLTDTVRLVKANHWESSYASFIYSGGSSDGCEVAKDAKSGHSANSALSSEQSKDSAVKKRQTEVRIFCSPNDVQPVVRSVSETHTCEYLMVVASELLCHHKDFAPAMPNIQEIVCAPIAEPKMQKM